MFPVVMAMAMSFVLYPLVRKLKKIRFWGKPLPPSIAIAISFLLVGLCCYGLITFFVKPLLLQVNYVLTHIPAISHSTTSFLSTDFYQDKVASLPLNVRSMVISLMDSLTASFVALVKGLMSSTFGMAAGMLSLFIVPFISFYFLKDWSSLRKMFVCIFALKSRPLVYRITSDVGSALCEYGVGMMKMCLIAGICLTGIATVLTPSYALVLGTMAAVLELVPFVGPFICTLTAIFFAYITSPSLVLPMLLGYVLYYVLDSQIILPQVMKRSLNIHPVLIIVGVLVGGKIFGILGVVFAVPVLCMGRVLYKYLWHRGEDEE